MNALTVVLAVLAAVANAAASVLQRRAATEEAADGSGRMGAVRWLGHVIHRPYWLAGAAMLGVSGGLQAGALAVGRLSVVQPVLASELLFTLIVGSFVFRRRPDRLTWLSFLALGCGLALFLGSAAPAAGRDTAPAGAWIPVGLAVLCVVAVLVGVARLVRGAPRAAVLGLASAVAFAATAALMKEVTGRIPEGWSAVFGGWPLYATGVAGAVAFLLLQGAFRAGTLTASQPALTLGDAMTSVVLGWALFDERITLGWHLVPEVAGAVLVAVGSIGLVRAPAVSGAWDADRAPPAAERAGRSSP
ncbi:DMT family transporter [Streptomyces sp. NPDC008313]|uniref:DMT family transporter n=1 Tax=Streptomyces sp. NPDC008313 TaxID=3364826 RepID=UPI0036EDAE1D